MKRAVIAISALLLIQGTTFAHEGENHAKKHKEDAQMVKLHKMMPVYAQSQAKINEALSSGDAATIKNETGKILATIPDLKKSKPHKNLKQLATFRKIASEFEGDVKKTALMANSGNFGGAKDAFQAAQMRCNECHTKFRD
jgi:soluble cytochrome b562